MSGFGSTFHTIDAKGLRHTGTEPNPAGYTHGDEVNDEEA